MVLATSNQSPTAGFVDFCELEHVSGRPFDGRRRVGRGYQTVTEHTAEGRSHDTCTALWDALREHAEEHGPGSYRIYALAHDDQPAAFYTFRIDAELDEDSNAEVRAEQLSYRQLALDYRTFAQDALAGHASTLELLARVTQESGRTAAAFGKAFRELNEQQREISASNADVELQRELSQHSAKQLSEVGGLLKQLFAAATVKGSGGAIGILTPAQAEHVRSSETLSRLFLGERAEGPLLAELLREHHAGAHDALLVTLTDEQRTQLAAATGLPAATFVPVPRAPAPPTSARVATETPRSPRKRAK